MKRVKFILIALLVIYGFYVIMRNLFSGDIAKIISVVIGIPLLWFLSGRQAKKRVEKESEEKSQARNAQNTEIPVDVINGISDCPSCKVKNNKLYDICEKCGQPVTKE